MPNQQNNQTTGQPNLESHSTQTHEHHHHHHHHRNKVVRRVVIVLCVLLGIAAIAAASGYMVFHHYYSLMDHGTEDEAVTSSQAFVPMAPEEVSAAEDENDNEVSVAPATEEEVNKIEDDLRKNLEEMETASDLYSTDAFNILLIGVDSRANEFSGRSDAMILVSINKTTKKVVMTSFLRDIYCSIPGYENTRLNHSYAYGGTELLTATIKANFGITVDRCLVVNFYLVMDLVDAVGGIDLDLTADEIGYMNSYINSHNRLLGNPSGTDIIPVQDVENLHVNGNQALAYARVRYVGTDFARTGRQRTVITKVLEKIKKMSLGSINNLATEFLPRVSTDLTEGDCATLLLMALSLGDYQIENLTVPVDGTWQYANIRGMSVISVDFGANARAWHAAVEGSAD
ncbi:LCP family protein [uncultured Dysosmobacter sp.]|uniref:LCP family protein n=1 Tax=uncultured Dysosmobacter sp. TaxID=2591384 RepID=UPI002612298A|nr:LCP family protein [uncultured Dysosmobacter sp.]